MYIRRKQSLKLNSDKNPNNCKATNEIVLLF